MLAEYRAAYRQLFFDTDQSYADAGEYEQAIATLNQGVNYFGESDDFTSKIEEYKARLPISLLDMKVVDYQNTSVKDKSLQYEDIFGNTYQELIVMGKQSFIEFAPNGNFGYLSGTVFLHDNAGGDDAYSLQIYADEVLVYSSDMLGLRSDPVRIDVDISKARFVRLETTGSGWANTLCISGARFHN